jgi:16S rRNA (guanine527-N7)-methyltransferase
MIIMQELWLNFKRKHQLTDQQLQQFHDYYDLLIKTNELYNLTTITELEKVLTYHFDDSLILDQAIDITQLSMIADIGSGAGFPGIPLKIKYPHLTILLIEVTHKRQQFLHEVIEKLTLKNSEVCQLDWRTFLRKTAYPIDLFCARASLQPAELLRCFQPSSPYRQAQLVYWAASDWQAASKEEAFIEQTYAYQLNTKKRKLVFFKETV